VQAQRPPTEVQALVQHFDDSLALLREGDATRPLFVPWDPDIRREFASVDRLWQSQRALWMAPLLPDDPVLMQSADEFVMAIDRLVLTIEHQLSGFTALLNLFQFAMMALAIAAAVVMLFTGYQYVINPLSHLQRGLAKVEARQFGTRIDVDTQDEFGQVAAGFNRMAANLQSLYEGLEAKVAAKTERIEAQRARLEALYEVSAFLAKANTIEELSKGFSQRVRSVMKADAVAVRWSDEANQRFLMLASDCFPQEMQDEERSLIAGACACGSLQPDARTRVIPIHSHDAAPMRQCAKVGYQNLVSVPVRLQQRMIGEIDLFFRSDIQLNADETELLDALASHLASALEGLRALAFLKIQAGLLRGAVQKQQPEKVQSTLDELDAGLKESINDVRELLVHFRTRTNTDDIEAALQETLQKFQHQTGLPTRLQLDGEGLPLPADVQVQVLHVVQEALSNVRKHADASHVSLDVHKGSQWRFVVRDNGSGFDTAQQHGETHVGTKIMRERAERIGASVLIESRVGQGTTVTLTLPPNPVTASGAATVGLDFSESVFTTP
jgi:two-component system, NarL family, nitrate/nitrite sensor histidine kinase NarX